LAAQLIEQFKGEAGRPHALSSIQLTPSSGGIFDVLLNGEKIFSKQAIGRHAEPGEVEQLIANRLQS